jgi:hypothetical protein
MGWRRRATEGVDATAAKLRTKSGLPKHCAWNYDRHGKRRVRFRKAGFSTYLAGIPWSEDFMRQYAAALEGVKAQVSNGVGVGRTHPGSFNALCVSYYRSPEFRGLQESTQTLRRNIIERSYEHKAALYRRWRVRSDVRRQRSRGSCGATPPPAAAVWSIARRLRNGTPSDQPDDQSRQSFGLGYFFAIAANMPASEARAIDIRQGSEVADGRHVQ